MATLIYPPFKVDYTEKEGINLTSLPLNEKIERIEEWLLENQRSKDKSMLYIVMYDIENNKVRTQVAKYLIKKGCLRIQKSVYLAKSNRTLYKDICEALKDINEMYENDDSIFVLPIPEEKF